MEVNRLMKYISSCDSKDLYSHCHCVAFSLGDSGKSLNVGPQFSHLRMKLLD